jgi:tRNA pseudouridine38-40 synthase
LTVEYDGTAFAGWQRQDNQTTVQGCLEKAFLAMTNQVVCVRGAGRTDAGVHALGQVASVDVTSRIPNLGFLRGLNTLVPRDIAVIDVTDMPVGWSARHDAQGKLYRYDIWNHAVRSPRHERTAWHIYKSLDVHRMREAAHLFVGEHDFRAFRAADCERLTTGRRMDRAEVYQEAGLIRFEVLGTAFLKNMVRILAGTLVAAGEGKMSVEHVRMLLIDGNRAQAGVTAPAHGLTLVQVIY